MATLEEAIALAVRVHFGQVDKVGAPYILHPLRLMLKMSEEEERMVAVLHDVVEDTTVTFDDLRALGFSPTVLEALEILTHRPGESYEAYIDRIAPHPLATRVKLADLEDNMDIRRLDHRCGDADWARLKRYRSAWSLLRKLPPP